MGPAPRRGACGPTAALPGVRRGVGARLTLLAGTPAGHDIDAFDAHGERLLVRTPDTLDSPGRGVGTYRVLTPRGSAAGGRAGGLYSETEFDLAALQPLRAHLVELGRSCVDPESGKRA